MPNPAQSLHLEPLISVLRSVADDAVRTFMETVLDSLKSEMFSLRILFSTVLVRSDMSQIKSLRES
jgi:hypothetical protein